MLFQLETAAQQSSHHTYRLVQSALQHCYSTYADGDLTFEDYVVLEEVVLSVLSRLG